MSDDIDWKAALTNNDRCDDAPKTSKAATAAAGGMKVLGIQFAPLKIPFKVPFSFVFRFLMNISFVCTSFFHINPSYLEKKRNVFFHLGRLSLLGFTRLNDHVRPVRSHFHPRARPAVGLKLSDVDAVGYRRR